MILVLAVILMVCSFKLTGFVLRAGLMLLGIGIAIVAFTLLSPLLMLMAPLFGLHSLQELYL